MSLTIDPCKNVDVQIAFIFDSWPSCCEQIIQTIWKIFCDCIGCLIFCFQELSKPLEDDEDPAPPLKQILRPLSAKERVFGSSQLGAIALSYCDCKDAKKLKLVSKDFGPLFDSAIRSQIAQRRSVERFQLKDYKEFSMDTSLSCVLDRMLNLRNVILFSFTLEEITDIAQSQRTFQWTSLTLTNYGCSAHAFLPQILKKCPNLQHISVHNDKFLDDQLEKDIAGNCKDLRSIELNGSLITVKGIAKLFAECPNLESISMPHHKDPGGMDDEDFIKVFKEYGRQLKRLNFYDIFAEETWTIVLSHCPHLISLGVDLSDKEAAQKIASILKNLEELTLYRKYQANDLAMPFIKQCPKLSKMNLDVDISPETLIALQAMPHLTHLTLKSRKIGHLDFVSFIRNANRLKMITLDFEGISEDALRAIKLLRPDLEIFDAVVRRFSFTLALDNSGKYHKRDPVAIKRRIARGEKDV